MIICVCRRISDRTMRENIAEGARTPGAIFRANGCAPQCGICLPVVKGIINQAAGRTCAASVAAPAMDLDMAVAAAE